MKCVQFRGRLDNDPEISHGGAHHAVSFLLAVPRRRRADGESGGVVFIDVVTLDALAERLAGQLTKGRQVAVRGRLEQREWETEDGTTRSHLQVVADRVTRLGTRRAEVDAA